MRTKPVEGELRVFGSPAPGALSREVVKAINQPFHLQVGFLQPSHHLCLHPPSLFVVAGRHQLHLRPHLVPGPNLELKLSPMFLFFLSEGLDHFLSNSSQLFLVASNPLVEFWVHGFVDRLLLNLGTRGRVLLDSRQRWESDVTNAASV